MRCRKQYVLFVQKRVKRCANEWVQGEGRFITFVFFFEDKKGDSIENNKIKGYKSTLTTPHPGPISYNKKITGNLKNSIIFFRFTTTFPEYSIILFKTVRI